MKVSVEGEVEAPRARPLSGGLWTLFSWLRRDDASSSESLSSAGSDRTAASFAFLTPPPRAPATPLPPPSPPSDTYKKRVRDRNLRRQHDRNLTLHSKYGLYRCDGGYDAFSLPFPRRSGEPDREERARSECGQLRAAYVPGKRRAPAPPATASLTRRRPRKRPAPLPPLTFNNSLKENKSPAQAKQNIIVHMNPDRRPLSTSDVPTGCKSEKYSKKDNSTKDSKPRTEKSFLKQIFENRKRNSAVESFPGKILPSISELDKQAAEIIESCKLKVIDPNNEFGLSASTSSENTWFCTRCLRKYNSTVVTCLHCLPEQQKLASNVYESVTKAGNASSIYTQTTSKALPNVAETNRLSMVGMDEKQKLKDMLKEMKDSLPKRPKHDKHYQVQRKDKDTAENKGDKREVEGAVLETPTLRIGTVIRSEEIVLPSTSQQISVKLKDPITKQDATIDAKPNRATEIAIITQPVVLVAPIIKNNLPLNNKSGNKSESIRTVPSQSLVNTEANNTTSPKVTLSQSNKDSFLMNDVHNIGSEKINIHTPLKISSLFNPVYIPKSSLSEVQQTRNKFLLQVGTNSSIQVKNEIKPIVQTTSNEVQTSSPSIPSVSHLETFKVPPNLHSKSPETNKTEENKIQKEQPPSLKNSVEVPEKSMMDKEKPLPIILDIGLKHKNDAHAAKESVLAHRVTNLNSSFYQNPSSSYVVRLTTDQHSRRRNLINQLEQSIAKGDERAAAEAAVKLAQLKLSCSVLSFSSQIVGESSKIAVQIPDSDTVYKSDDSTSQTTLVQSKATTVLDQNVNKTIDPKLNTPTQQPQLTATKILPTNKVSDSNEKPSAQPPTKVNTSVQCMEIVSSKDKCKQNIEKSTSIKNEVLRPPLITKEQAAKNDPQTPTPTVQPSTSKVNDNVVFIEVWVEDREATRGPVRLPISRHAVMGDLRRQAETTLGLVAGMQRWIVGHALCTNDSTTLASLAGPDLTAPFYLCLVQSEINGQPTGCNAETTEIEKTGNVYSELVQLEQCAIVPNAEPFECGVCMEPCAVGGGAILRDCVHAFCRECLSDLVRYCKEPLVSCPAMGCPGILQEREIRAVVPPDEYEKWLARGLAAAESGTRNSFHCRTRDCTGWALCEPGVRQFPCPVCRRTNCVPCQAIHEGESCKQHRLRLQQAENSQLSDSINTDEGTKALLNTLISKGEALPCPGCSTIITKKWGCDWVKCSACKTEICWVTRGCRWGPGGRGDTSGGCRCGVNGKRCHPSCGYCH